MNGRSLTIAGFAALVAALAANGRSAVDAVAAAFDFMMRLATALPMGVWSVVLSLTIATLTWAHLNRAATFASRDRMGALALHSESMALLIGIAVTMAQSMVLTPRTTRELLFALLLGILVGLAAPYVGKVIAALVAKVIA